MRHPAGSILKYNRLWRAGQHYSYIFFKVSHETAKGTIMGHYIDFTRTYEDVTHDYSTERWIVSPSKTRGNGCCCCCCCFSSSFVLFVPP